MKKEFFTAGITPKLLLAGILPPAIVAIFACLAFSIVNMGIIKKNVSSAAYAAIYKLEGQIQSILQPNMDKMSNWQAIVKESHEEKVLRRVMKGISNDLAKDTMFYYATKISRFDPEGFFVNSVGWIPDKSWEPSSRDWFKLAEKNSGKFTFTEPYVDSRTGRVCTTFSQSVSGNDGKLLGVAAMDVMLDDLTKLVNETKISNNSSIYILLDDGRFLTNPDENKIINVNYFDEEIAEVLKKEGLTVSQYLDKNIRAFIRGGHYYAVSPVGKSPWFIVVDGPVSDFNATFLRNLVIILCILLVLGGLSVFVNIALVGSMRHKETSLAKKLIAEIQNLASSSKENAATSQDQNVAVKEIVATMEDNTALSESISQKVKDVSDVAAKTSSNVSDGVAYLEESVRQFQEIALANQKTISGIKALGEKIENIWDIVTLINSVADQAKIIAFNAELEASSAGEAGRNFHIVATEIRRLADGIIDGTKEIKAKITEIQQSSDSLILMSENGTEKIQSGVNSTKSLEERFVNIKNASEVTAASSSDITTIIQQQALASEQILLTLKQIAAGVEKFTSATGSISLATENVMTIAKDLNK